MDCSLIFIDICVESKYSLFLTCLLRFQSRYKYYFYTNKKIDMQISIMCGIYSLIGIYKKIDGIYFFK